MDAWKQHDQYSWQSGEYWLALTYVRGTPRFSCWYVPIRHGKKVPHGERQLLDIVDMRITAITICQNHYTKKNPNRAAIAETEIEKARRILDG